MKVGNAIRIIICCIIIGGFAGWGKAALSGEGDLGQSKGTGVGSGAGLLVGVLITGAAAFKGGKKDGEENANG